MKKILSLIMLLFAGARIFAQGLSFGVEGGINANSMQLKNSATDFDFVPGFCFGAGAEYAFNEITALQVQVLFHHKNGFSFVRNGNMQKLTFMTLDFPLLIKLTFSGIESVAGNFSVFAGPNFSVRLGNVKTSAGGFSADWDNPLSVGYFAAGIAAGAEYAFTKADGFRMGLSFVMDISDFFDSEGTEAQRYFLMPYISYWF